MTPCENCHEPTPGHDLVHYGSIENGYRTLCTRCVNMDMAERCGVDFEHVRFEPLAMPDKMGQFHEFHFVPRLLGDILALEAFELQDGAPSGYQFQIIGDAEDDLWDLMAKLIARIRHGLDVTYLTEERGQLHIAGETVCGRISSSLDEDGYDAPSVIIDGREVSWDEFGRMLSAFEGWQFKLQIVDRSDAT